MCMHKYTHDIVLLGVSVEFFGSSRSGLALRDSDVNINLNYEEKEGDVIFVCETV